nr:MAG TPA: hypothetical protein [Caudoviricetes sp.]
MVPPCFVLTTLYIAKDVLSTPFFDLLKIF